MSLLSPELRLLRLGDIYHKAGVLSPDLVPADQVPACVCATAAAERARGRMAALDAVNRRCRRDTL